jgi:hypothetical protein
MNPCMNAGGPGFGIASVTVTISAASAQPLLRTAIVLSSLSSTRSRTGVPTVAGTVESHYLPLTAEQYAGAMAQFEIESRYPPVTAERYAGVRRGPRSIDERRTVSPACRPLGE